MDKTTPKKYPLVHFRPGKDYPKWQAIWDELQAQCPPGVFISWADVARHVLALYLEYKQLQAANHD